MVVQMFKKILIANRGEIACRIIETARQLGVQTVVVYAQGEHHAKHVRAADYGYQLEGLTLQDSYLNITQIITIAKNAQVDAIHPGYGFLAENAEFARQCAQNKLTFIGPSPEVIALMGAKNAAKQAMTEAGLTVLPGYHGADQSLTTLREAAQQIGFPILIKGAAGGGGKGMQIVWQMAEFDQAVAKSQRESEHYFGDGTLILETYLENPRHIESQIFADSQGNCIHLFERECSIQRRHQKIIEEAPAPGLSEQLRRQIGEQSVRAAKAIGYVGAGTFEYLLAHDQQFYFMEANTRLQVEHAVTEMITGIDLVAWQLKVAAGEGLPFSQDAISFKGCAIEARIYAEDAQQNFLPMTGTIDVLEEPQQNVYVRVDSGIQQGDVVSVHYDPMLAKLVCWASSRDACITRVRQALYQYHILGVTTNLNFIEAIMASPAFMAGTVDTRFVERTLAEILAVFTPSDESILLLSALAWLREQEYTAQAMARHNGVPCSPWAVTDNWRLNAVAPQAIELLSAGKTHHLTVTQQIGYDEITMQQRCYRVSSEWLTTDELLAHCEGRQLRAKVLRYKQFFIVYYQGLRYTVALPNSSVAADAVSNQQAGALMAPTPGTIVDILVKPGSVVECGDHLVVISAMKMEHTIVAPHKGVIAAIRYAVGDLIEEGAQLLTFAAPCGDLA